MFSVSPSGRTQTCTDTVTFLRHVFHLSDILSGGIRKIINDLRVSNDRCSKLLLMKNSQTEYELRDNQNRVRFHCSFFHFRFKPVSGQYFRDVPATSIKRVNANEYRLIHKTINHVRMHKITPFAFRSKRRMYEERVVHRLC